MAIKHEQEQKYWGQYTMLNTSASEIVKKSREMIETLEKYMEEIKYDIKRHKEICKEMREDNQNPSMHPTIINVVADTFEKEMNVAEEALKMYIVMVEEFWTMNRYICDTHKEKKEDYE